RATRPLGETVSTKPLACALGFFFASTADLAHPGPLPAGGAAGLGPVMPPQQNGKILRANGFLPQATPVRNGEAYQVRAIDRRGRPGGGAVERRCGHLLRVA